MPDQTTSWLDEHLIDDQRWAPTETWSVDGLIEEADALVSAASTTSTADDVDTSESTATTADGVGGWLDTVEIAALEASDDPIEVVEADLGAAIDMSIGGGFLGADAGMEGFDGTASTPTGTIDPFDVMLESGGDAADTATASGEPGDGGAVAVDVADEIAPARTTPPDAATPSVTSESAAGEPDPAGGDPEAPDFGIVTPGTATGPAHPDPFADVLDLDEPEVAWTESDTGAADQPGGDAPDHDQPSPDDGDLLP